MRVILSIAILSIFMGPAVAQQVIPMDETDIDLKILTWHYNRYEKAPPGEWSVIAKDGIGYFRVNFEFNGDQIGTLYDEEGVILHERRIWDIDKVPKPVTDVLDYRIVKYKLQSFLQETKFESKKPIETNYRVEAHTKTGGIVVYWFDENFKILPDKKDELAIN